MDSETKGHQPTFADLVGGGELLLICCAVSADSMGRILNHARKHKGGLDFVGCLLLICSLLTIVFCTILYVAQYAIVHSELDIKALVVWSTRMAEATFVIGIWTTLFATD